MSRRLTAEEVVAATGLTIARLRLMHSLGSFRCDGDGMYREVDVERSLERRSERR